MRTWFETYKPAASRRTHLLLAACMWSVVGCLLMLVGMNWLLGQQRAGMLLLIAVAAALLKSRLILDRIARRNVARIRSRDDNRCIGGFLSVKSWLIIAGMMFAGRLLRGSSLSRSLVGCLYAAIGMALVLSSRHLWRSWRDARGKPLDVQ